VQRAAGDDLGDLGIGECARDDTTSAHRVDAGEDNVDEIVLERGNGNGQ
jgi:hypothetical protein